MRSCANQWLLTILWKIRRFRFFFSRCEYLKAKEEEKDTKEAAEEFESRSQLEPSVVIELVSVNGIYS
jgi:hypothetical protein